MKFTEQSAGAVQTDTEKLAAFGVIDAPVFPRVIQNHFHLRRPSCSNLGFLPDMSGAQRRWSFTAGSRLAQPEVSESEVFDVDISPVTFDQCAFNQVDQFPNVAGGIMGI